MVAESNPAWRDDDDGAAEFPQILLVQKMHEHALHRRSILIAELENDDVGMHAR